MTINDLPVGRDVDETLRLVQAFQQVDEHGEGKETMHFLTLVFPTTQSPWNIVLNSTYSTVP